MHKQFPLPEEYAPYYEQYLVNYQHFSLLKSIKHKNKISKRIIRSIPKEKWNYRYAENKWTTKEIIQHLIDAERIFVNRALHILREDNSPINPFDEDKYIEKAQTENRSAKNITKEFLAVSQATYYFFENLTEEQLLKKMIYNENFISVRALAYIICAHATHHCNIIKERYL